MKKLLLLAIILLLLPVSISNAQAPGTGSCSVTPNPVDLSNRTSNTFYLDATGLVPNADYVATFTDSAGYVETMIAFSYADGTMHFPRTPNLDIPEPLSPGNIDVVMTIAKGQTQKDKTTYICSFVAF